ncbi:MAG TPA: DEAD/DEAH box helicase [Spirochaetota bacterium]|nr:DEAD/DEAH box helicase [Spirochaetota bacterium]HOD16246.1 DEAD/DEAH box helicase [Spirochaetota bacterium]HPG51130.1 DEAD/DEAH box helicase [Spirochaetota bacterium]HPN10950.1 DEAD/DEAH box helicase [Spirochaetota bacterium]
MLFTELTLHPSVMRGIEEAGFTECTPVQEMTFQKTLAGKDVMVQSQTGTGKTAAFLITIFNLFLSDEKYRNKKALVLTPTRELAVQVEQDAQLLGKHTGLKFGCFYGGVGYVTQDRLLKEELNLYIGTPGRLIDYQKSGKIDFSKFEVLVIDEADRMFDMGFIPDIRYMLKRMVPPAERITMLYSATLSTGVKNLAWEYMNDPAEIEINPEHLTVDLITQELYHIGREEKFNLMLGILRKEKPKSALIFTNMKRTAERVSRRLKENGIANDYISGDLPQNQRLHIIDAIKAGETEILVATDVAARGLHIEDLDMVINYDLPEDNQNYVHRIGRTARAGKTGRAISLACEEDVFNLGPIEKLIGMKIPVMWADESLVVEAAGAPISSRRDRPGGGRGRDGGRRGGRPGERGRGPRERRKTADTRAYGAPVTPGEPAAAAETSAAASDRPRRRRESRKQDESARIDQLRRRPLAGEEPRRELHPHKPAAEKQQPPADGEARQGKKRRRRRKGKGGAAGEVPAARPREQAQQPERQQKPRPERQPRRQEQRERRKPPRNQGQPHRQRLSRDATPEERLEYFKNKYGENFEKTRIIDSSGKKPKPKTLVQSIKGLFSRKKKKEDE